MPRPYTPLIPTAGIPGSEQGFDTGWLQFLTFFAEFQVSPRRSVAPRQ